MIDNIEFELLRWALSSTVTPPNSHAINEEKLFSLAREHRVIPRFLGRLESDSHPAITASFKARLRFAQMMIEREMRYQVEQTQRIQQFDDSPFIYIKGATVYALTGDKKTIRQSGDIDLLAANPDKLFEAMCNIGYIGERKSGDYRGLTHEHSVLNGFGVLVEIHRCHFVHYGQIVGNKKEFSGQRLGLCGVNPVYYDELSVFKTLSTIEGVKGLPILTAAAAAFMICCHIGTNVVRIHTQHLKSTLGELADFIDLVNHPEFKLDEFKYLLEKYNAYHIASLAVVTAIHFLDASFPILEKLKEINVNADFCAPLDAHICFGVSLQEMLQPLDLSDRVDLMGKQSIVLSDKWQEMPVERYIFHSKSTPNANIKIEFLDNNIQLQFLWEVFSGINDEIHFWYSSWLAEARNSIVFKNNEFSYTEGMSNISAENTEKGILFTITMTDVSKDSLGDVLLILQYWSYEEKFMEDKREKNIECVIVMPINIIAG